MSVWRKLRGADDRVMESQVGWVLPGGLAYKLGRRAGRLGTDPPWRRWPFIGGLLDGWNYNVGRERSLRERADLDS